MHVAVIGAGASGLCAARHLTAPNSGFTCVVFEQSDTIGGTWVYTEQTECDRYGLPICSAMYKNLRTNLGKENMEFPGFPFAHSKSFIPAADVLHYLQDYTKEYKLEEHIRFHHHVKRVTRKDNKWQLTVIDLPTNEANEEEFDAVVVCNGHYSVPLYGNFPGILGFGGQVIHSHSYREPELYANQTVLVCGAGPSGIDISYDLADYASKIYLSHKNDLCDQVFPMNVKLMPVVREVKQDHVVFEDGSVSDHIHTIILCTGYLYSFPFLTPECGITVEEGKFVQPLYKQIVNINEPTMAFIGLPFRTFLFPMFDHQVRFFLKTLTKEVKLPTKEEMTVAYNIFIKKKREQQVPLSNYFNIANELKAYLDDLEESGQLEPISPVVYDIYKTTQYLRKKHLPVYRDTVFEVIDYKSFRISGLNSSEETIDMDAITSVLGQTELK